MFPKEKKPKVRMVGNENGELTEASLKIDEKCRDDYFETVKRVADKVMAYHKKGKMPSEKDMMEFAHAVANHQVWHVVCLERKLDRACQKGGENYKKIRETASQTIDNAIEFLEKVGNENKAHPETHMGLYRHAARLLRQVATIQERYKFSQSEWKKISKPMNDPDDGGPMGGEGGVVGAACNNVANLYYWKNLNPPTKEGEAMYGGDGANFAVARFWLEKGAKAGDLNARKSLGGIKMRAQMAGLGISVVDKGMDEKTGLPIGYNSGKVDEDSVEYSESAVNTTSALEEFIANRMKKKVKRRKTEPKDRDPNTGAKGEFVSKRCIVDGLVSKPHLNGEECVPSKWSEEKKRYGVYDFNSGGLWIKPVNIIPKSEYYTYVTDDDKSDDDSDHSGEEDEEDEEDEAAMAEKLRKANLTSGGKNARDMQSLKYFST